MRERRRLLFIPLATTIIASFVVACAPAAPRHAAPSRTTQPAAAVFVEAGVLAVGGEEVPSLDALASRGATDAPLMREALRVADATKPSELKVGATDGCFRAVVAANLPMRAWFEDDAHTPRGEVSAASTQSLVPPRGPACARKGETLRLVVDPGAGIARAVVWQSP